ncbi:hypothetical protein H4Q32_020632 [Labeo rohita]|uniref:Uncharacterized protein n=1 Tax=Labeo rohita TaxID=84645 RepID=A0ABQ8M211_LABRO|nr:hypothetical protein H4Q32_020632 [Labeo rohita]
MAEHTVREAMVDQGTRGAMVDQGAQEAMVDQGAQEAMAEQTVQGAMVGQGAQEAMAEQTVQGAMVGQGAQEAMVGQGARGAMVDQGAQEAMVDQGAQEAMVGQGAQEAMVGQGAREAVAEQTVQRAMADQGDREAVAEQAVQAYSPSPNPPIFCGEIRVLQARDSSGGAGSGGRWYWRALWRAGQDQQRRKRAGWDQRRQRRRREDRGIKPHGERQWTLGMKCQLCHAVRMSVHLVGEHQGGDRHTPKLSSERGQATDTQATHIAWQKWGTQFQMKEGHSNQVSNTAIFRYLCYVSYLLAI